MTVSIQKRGTISSITVSGQQIKIVVKSQSGTVTKTFSVKMQRVFEDVTKGMLHSVAIWDVFDNGNAVGVQVTAAETKLATAAAKLVRGKPSAIVTDASLSSLSIAGKKHI